MQTRVSGFTRICTYDRAGYAWSDPGPKPRTFAQLNLELRDALAKLGEHAPFVLVGHSFGGPVVRNFAAAYREGVAGMVLVDAAHEDLRVAIQGKAVRIRDGAEGKAIPPPHERMEKPDFPALPRSAAPASPALDHLYDPLPDAAKRLQLWAQALPAIEDAEDDQRRWSTESLALMHSTPQAGILGAIPLIVLTRAEGGNDDHLDVPAVELERERKAGQARLAELSTNAKQVVVQSGHNMNLEAPDAVSTAIREVVLAVREHRGLR